MEGLPAVEGVGAWAEPALELVVGQRRRQRQALQRLLQRLGNGVTLGLLEAAERNEGTAEARGGNAEARRQPIEIDTRLAKQRDDLGKAVAGLGDQPR